MTEWKDVLPLVASSLGTDSKGIACILEFLQVLPEEVIEGRKINLSVCQVAEKWMTAKPTSRIKV